MNDAILTGFSAGLSLILAIGSQNAFVLRQGLRGEHVGLVCLACALSDADKSQPWPDGWCRCFGGVVQPSC